MTKNKKFFIKVFVVTTIFFAFLLFGDRDALQTKFVENIEKIEVVLGRIERLTGC